MPPEDEAEEVDTIAAEGADDIDGAQEGFSWVSYFSHLFSRIVCDEAHKMKNASNQILKAVDHLSSPLQW